MLDKTFKGTGSNRRISHRTQVSRLPCWAVFFSLHMTGSIIWLVFLRVRCLSSESDIITVTFILLSEIKDSGDAFSFCFLFSLVIIDKAWDHVETCCKHQETLSTFNSYHPAAN